MSPASLLLCLSILIAVPSCRAGTSYAILFGGTSQQDSIVGASFSGTTYNVSKYGNKLLQSEVLGFGFDGASTMVSVGTGTEKIAYSLNGAAFVGAGTQNNIFNTGQHVRFLGGQWVAVGSGNTHNFATSPTALSGTWTGRGKNHLTTTAYDVAYNSSTNVLCAVGEGTQTAAFSTDGGVTWQSSGRPFSTRGRGITSALGIFVAVGQGNGNQIYTSTTCDSGSWVGRSNLWQNNGAGYAVAFGNGLFVAVGDHNGEPSSIITSPDGFTWTGRGKSVLQGIGTDVVYASAPVNLWIASGSGGVNYAAYSSDGVVWIGMGKIAFDRGSAVMFAGIAFTAPGTPVAASLLFLSPLLLLATLCAALLA